MQSVLTQPTIHSSSRNKLRECRLCGHKRLHLFYSEGVHFHYKYYRCQNCGLVNYDLINGLDLDQYKYEFVDPTNENDKVNQSSDRTWQFINAVVPGPGKCLVIGRGIGKLLLNAQSAGWVVQGLDRSVENAEYLAEEFELNVAMGDILTHPIKGRHQFDLIILRQELQHQTSPVQLMNVIKPLLKNDGYLAINVPNIEGIAFRLKRWISKKGIYPQEWSRQYQPGHVAEYSLGAIEKLCSLTHFELVKWETYSLNQLRDSIFKYYGIGNFANALLKPI